MRSIRFLGLTCIAAFTGTAAAENAAQSATPAAARVADYTVTTAWPSRAPEARDDRLRYLNGSLCAERVDCSTSAAFSQSVGDRASRDYIDALSLGSYGPMNFKFTGDRVKLKVRF